jgi:hypothetical protein
MAVLAAGPDQHNRRKLKWNNELWLSPAERAPGKRIIPHPAVPEAQPRRPTSRPCAFPGPVSASRQNAAAGGKPLLQISRTRYLMPVLYSFYGHREPPASAGGLAH